MKKILVIGGAGYIGSHMVRLLEKEGYVVTVLDNLSNGTRQLTGNAEFIKGDIGNINFLNNLFYQKYFDCVMHFASFIEVGESIIKPAKYYDNNLIKTIILLNAMVKHDINCFIFSSSASVFGEPEYLPIDEKHKKNPLNSYGRTKLMIEDILQDYNKAYGLRFGALRYFNAAGADSSGEIGECHDPETHLIPLVLQVASGRRDDITVFGDDYNTPDGSAIRDYIHVNDLCDAHLKLFNYMEKGGKEQFFNLGTGDGYSVLEVIKMAEDVTYKEIKTIIAGRRAGDPATLIAGGNHARNILKWKPISSDLNKIIEDAWRWEEKLAAENW